MATATKARPRLTREQWEARALELAAEHGLIGTAKFVKRERDFEFWHVPSRDGREVRTIIVEVMSGEMGCGCTAGQYLNPCHHCGAVLHQRERDAREALEWADYCDWLEMRGW